VGEKSMKKAIQDAVAKNIAKINKEAYKKGKQLIQ
jgi:hypothetical protein